MVKIPPELLAEQPGFVLLSRCGRYSSVIGKAYDGMRNTGWYSEVFHLTSSCLRGEVYFFIQECNSSALYA